MVPTTVLVEATGQTGAYLSQTLLSHGYRVVVTSRNVEAADWWRFKSLRINDDVVRHSLNPSDQGALDVTIKTYQPSEIYYLAGPSSVAASFIDPARSFADITPPSTTSLKPFDRRNTGEVFSTLRARIVLVTSPQSRSTKNPPCIR